MKEGNQQMHANRSIYAPVVMAIADVPMNGSILPEEEYRPRAWIGRPVTLGHPTRNGEFRAAEERDRVGTIANAWVQDGKLMGTLKLDADAVPSRVKRLIEDEGTLDVSTGYFSQDTMSGDYAVNRDVIPDHLALLPDEDGACSWQDGCGLRAQTRGKRKLRVNNCCKECSHTEGTTNMHWVNQYLCDHALTNPNVIRNNARIPTVHDLAGVHRSRTDSPLTPEDDEAVAAMTAHENIREELTANRATSAKFRRNRTGQRQRPDADALVARTHAFHHEQEVRRRNGVAINAALGFAPGNSLHGHAVEVSEDDPEVAAMLGYQTIHEDLRTRNNKSRTRAR